MKTKVSVLAALIFLILSLFNFPMSNSIAAVVNGKQAEASAEKLQFKILLNDSQTNEIKAILSSFINENNFSQENSQSTLNKIETLLTPKQKAKFDIIKTEWWNNFLKGLNKQSLK